MRFSLVVILPRQLRLKDMLGGPRSALTCLAQREVLRRGDQMRGRPAKEREKEVVVVATSLLSLASPPDGASGRLQETGGGRRSS